MWTNVQLRVSMGAVTDAPTRRVLMSAAAKMIFSSNWTLTAKRASVRRLELSDVLSSVVSFSEQCPPDFILTSWGSCYKVFSDDHEARSVQDAKQHCQTYHTVADLVSVDTVQEKEFLAGLLATEGGDQSSNQSFNQPFNQ